MKSSTDAAKDLLRVARRAAAEARPGFWASLLSYLERRAAIKRQEQIAKRCRLGSHDYGHWAHQGDSKIFNSPADRLPTRIYRNYVGRCIHCGHPSSNRTEVV